MKAQFVLCSLPCLLMLGAESSRAQTVTCTWQLSGGAQGAFGGDSQLVFADIDIGFLTLKELYYSNGGSSCAPRCSFGSVTLQCGVTYVLHLYGNSCAPTLQSDGAAVSFLKQPSTADCTQSITPFPAGYILEFEKFYQLPPDAGLPVVFENVNPANGDQTVGLFPGGFSQYTDDKYHLTVKPKRIKFAADSLDPDGRSRVQAKLSFLNGASTNWFQGNVNWSILGDDVVGDKLGCTIDSSGWIRAGTEAGEISVRAMDAVTSRYVSGSLRIGCQSCGNGSCGIGQGTVANLRNALAVGLGTFPCDGSFMGSIRLKLTGPASSLTTRAGLIYDQDNTDNALPEIIRDGVGLRQVLAPQCFVDVFTTIPNTDYEVRFYLPENAGPKVQENGIFVYVPTAGSSPFRTWKVTSLDGGINSQFKITDPASVVGTFTWNPVDNGWTLARGNLSQEHKSVVNNVAGGAPPEAPNSRRIETIDISAPGSPTIIASKSKRTFATLNLGLTTRYNVLVEDRLDGLKPDGSVAHPGAPQNGDVITTNCYASTATTDGHHEKLVRVTRSNGSWEHYAYDSLNADRVAIVYTPWLDSVPPVDVNTAPTSVPHRKTVYDYTVLTDSGDAGTDQVTPRRTEEYVDVTGGAPQLVSRAYVVLTTDTSVYPTLDVRKDIACRDSGQTWNDPQIHTVPNPPNPANLTTTTRTFASGTFKGSLHSIDRPDGTRTVYTYTDTTLEVSEGAAGLGFTVTDGRRTVTTKTTQGIVQKVEVFDILNPSKKLLSDVWSGTVDAQGRFPTLTHLDGTAETYTYDCCNVTQIQDRDGATTVLTPDALSRIWQTTVYYQAVSQPITQTGIKTQNTLDAAGQVTKLTRVGTDNSSIDLMPSRVYDRAGRIVQEQNALLGTSSIVEDMTPGGRRRITTTYADTGTRVEEYYHDGRLAKVTGTAVQPIQYDYTLSAANELATKEIKLDSLGNTTEWTKTCTDFLGRGYNTVYADTTTQTETDNPSSQRFYKDNGQLWKERDPDSVLTVYIYNARAEVEYTMIGQKTEPMTPPTTPDTSGEHRITQQHTQVGSYTDGTAYDTMLTRVAEWTTLDSGDTIVSGETHTSITPPPIGQALVRQWSIAYPGTPYQQVVKTVTAYGTAGSRTVTVTYPDNSYQISVFSYGRIASVSRYPSSGGPVISASYQYDPHGQLLSATDSRNGATTNHYNNADQVTSVTSPAPGDGSPAETRITAYDNLGRPTQVTEADGGIVYTRYYKNGQVKLTWGTRTYASGYEYDAQGRVAKLYTWQSFTAPDPSITEPPFPSGSAITIWDYDPNRGWLNDKRYADATGPNYTYTRGARLKTRTWWRAVPGAGSTRLLTTYTYDFEQDPSILTRRAGYLAKIDYNDSGVPAGEISTPGLTFDYDRRGRGRTVTQASVPSVTTSLNWHPAGPLNSESYGGNSHFLDSLSVVAVNVDQANVLRRASLEVQKSAAAIAGTTVSYGYDTASRLQTVTSVGAASVPFSATYGYLLNSDLIQATTFKQDQNIRLTTTRQLDFLERLQSISPAPSAAAQPPLARTYVYNSANQRVMRADGDLTYWQYAYDNKGQVTSAKHLWPEGAVVPGQQFEFTFDDIGNRLSAREGGDQNGSGLRQTTYAPNNVNWYFSRSISAADRKIDVMGLGLVQNGTPATVTINGANPDYRRGEYFWKALAGSGTGPNWLGVTVSAGSLPVTANGSVYIPPQSDTFNYDGDGNLTSDARWLYKWDAENRLVRMDTQASAAAAGVPAKRIQYIYDYQGRLIRRQVFSGTLNGNSINWSSSPDGTVGADLVFLYDGFRCVAVLKTDQTLYQAFVWGVDISGTISGAGGVGGLVMFRRAVGASTETYFPTYDGNGNVTGLVNGNDGTIPARYEYGPFGHLLRVSGEPAALDNPFRFSTKYQDDYSDLLYYGYRFYNPSLGRWLSRDPAGEEVAINLMVFVSNSPTMSVDYLGLRNVVIAFYIEPGAALVTREVERHLDNTVISASWGLKRDTIKVIFIHRAAKTDENGLQYSRKVFAKFLTKKDCITGFGVNIQQETGNPRSPVGYPGNRGGIAIVASALDVTRQRAADNNWPFDMNVAVANVIAHEALFHRMGGFRDPVSKFVSTPNPTYIEAPRLTQYLIFNEGQIKKETIEAIKHLLDLE